jgi:hypothetical protein
MTVVDLLSLGLLWSAVSLGPAVLMGGLLAFGRGAPRGRGGRGGAVGLMGRHLADQPGGAVSYQIVCLSSEYHHAWTTLVDALANGRDHTAHLAPDPQPAVPAPLQAAREQTGGRGDPGPQPFDGGAQPMVDLRPLGRQTWRPHNPVDCALAMSGWRCRCRDAVNLACRICTLRRPSWTSPSLRLLIREKLADGPLPRAPILRAWGDPDHATCDGCGETVTAARLVMENHDAASGGSSASRASTFGMSSVRFRDASRASVSARPLSVQGPGARSGRPWAPAPAARPATSAAP